MVVLRRLAMWAVLVLGLAPPTLAHARWLRAESPLFIVYSDGGESDLRKFTDQLEQFDAFLRIITSAPKPAVGQKLTVYLVAGQRGLFQVSPYKPPNAYGFYAARASGIAAVVVRTDQGPLMVSGQQVLFHEYTHHFVEQYFPGAYPIWYQEGFAEVCSTMTFKVDKVEFANALPNRLMWLGTHAWMPVEKLFAPPSVKTMREEMFYPEAWLATHYVLRHPDAQAKLKLYILALRRGEEPAPAFKQSFGMDFAAFQKVLSAYFSKGMTYSILSRPKSEPAAISIVTMPPSADRLLLLHARLVAEEVKPEDRAALVSQVRAAAASFPDDPLALRTLALAEVELGEPAAADAPLDKLLQVNPSDLEGLYLKGLRYAAAGWKNTDSRSAWFSKARPYLVRAYKADPHYVPTLWLLGVSLDTSDGKPSDNQVNALDNAYLLAPQVDEIGMDAARALMRVERYPEAAEILEGIAYAPHPSERAEFALKMLADAKSHLAKPTVALVPAAP